MRKLKLRDDSESNKRSTSIFEDFALDRELIPANKDQILSKILVSISNQDKTDFYPLVGELFSLIGFNCTVTREGDTNNRADATLIHDSLSAPIEIKSPAETRVINVKSIRQAVENKVVLISRRFYQTQYETSTLAIGFEYPAQRSTVYELIDNVYSTYKINVGIISIRDLLSIAWDVTVEGMDFSMDKIVSFRGQFCR